MGRKKGNNSSTPELDLHGVKHADAEILVEDYVLMRTPPVRIITGNSNAMQAIVSKVLKRHNYVFTVYTGIVVVWSE